MPTAQPAVFDPQPQWPVEALQSGARVGQPFTRQSSVPSERQLKPPRTVGQDRHCTAEPPDGTSQDAVPSGHELREWHGTQICAVKDWFQSQTRD